MPRRRIIVSPQGGGLKFIDPFKLPQATQGLAYSFHLNYVGVVGATIFNVQSQTGSNTWAVDPSSGILSGTPGTAQLGNTVTVLITDSIGNHDIRTFTLDVGSSLAMVTTFLPVATVGTAYSATMAGTGGTPPYTFPLTGSLPAGITYNATTGVFAGTPTTPVVSSLSISISDAHPTTVGPIAFSLTVNAAITPPSTTAYKFNPNHYLMTENTYNPTVAFGKAEIDVIKTHQGAFVGYGFAQTWAQMEVASTNFNNPSNILQQYPGFANFAAIFNYLQLQIPGWRMVCYLNANSNIRINTPANIATTNYGAGFPVPQYIATCGGSLVVPNSYGSGSTTTYTIAQARGTAGFYGFGVYGAQPTAYSGYNAALWDPGINQLWTNLWEAFSKYKFLITAGPLSGQTLGINENPLIEWLGVEDEVSYTLTAGSYPSGGNVPGFTNNPPLNTNSANSPTPSNWRTYRRQWFTKVTGFFPNTLIAGCESFGFSANGTDTAPAQAAWINNDISGAGLSSIRGVAYSDSDTYGTDWAPTSAINANPAKQGFVGISAAIYPVTPIPPVTNASLVGVMPFIAQIQPLDYVIRLPSGVAASSAAAVNTLFAQSQVTKATHVLWNVADSTTFGTTALTTYLGPAVAALGLPTQTLPSSMAIPTRALGTNLGAVSPNNPEQPFLNIFKNGTGNYNGRYNTSGWITATVVGGGSDTDEGAYLQMDSNGYPTSVTGSAIGRSFTCVYMSLNQGMAASTNGTFYPGGSYTLTFDGAGTIKITGDATLTTSTSGTTFTPTVSGNGLRVGITATTTGNNIRNIAIVETSRVSSYLAGEIFHPNFLASLANYKCLRVMDWMNTTDQIFIPNTNHLSSGATSLTMGSAWLGYTGTFPAYFPNGDLRNVSLTAYANTCTWTGGTSSTMPTDQIFISRNLPWASRPLPSNCFWNTPYGPPIEIMVALCNKLGCDFWINIPIDANDTWITGMHNVVHDGTGAQAPYGGLNAPLRLRSEISNEVWNFFLGNTPGSNYKMAAVMGGNMFGGGGFAIAPDNYTCNRGYYGYMCSHNATIAASVWGADFARCIPMCAGQMYTQPTIDAMNSTLWGAGSPAKNNTGIKSLAIAPYFDASGFTQADIVTILAQPDGGISYLAQSFTSKNMTGPSATLSSVPTGGWLSITQSGINDNVAMIASTFPTRSLIAYEGGQSLTPNASYNSILTGPQLTAWGNLTTAFQENPAMKTVYDTYLAMWKNSVGTGANNIFMHFSSCTVWAPTFGYWGSIKNVLDTFSPITSAPGKWQSLQNYVLGN